MKQKNADGGRKPDLSRHINLRARPVARILAAVAVAVVVAVGGAVFASPARSQSILRDTETEFFFRDLALPVYEAAGVDTERLRLFVDAEPSINAFVTASHIIVLSAGLVQRAADPSDLLGVIAHETGHIAAGHHLATAEAALYAERQFLLSAALGVVLAGAIGNPTALGAAGAAGTEISQKGLLAHSRAHEQAADQAAVNYLAAAERSPVGILRVMRYLEEQENLSIEVNPYLRTHPISSERVSFLEGALERSAYADVAPSAEEMETLRRIKAKLAAYLDPDDFHRRYPAADVSVAARYGRAVANWREGKLRECVALLRELIAEEPDNPYFHEFLGQVLFTAGRAEESAASYREAVRLLPDAPLLRLGWAAALLEQRSPRADKVALRQLSLVNDARESPGVALRLTNIAETRQGSTGRATLALAELRLIEGRLGEAAVLAQRALRELSEQEQASRLRAMDLLAVIGDQTDENDDEDDDENDESPPLR
ncbi:MAG: M48 family metalloprotease [Alphaproteobacteria bacterium]|nr:M48 family metalloprotease [Alphaproteobacteria bacterium]